MWRLSDRDAAERFTDRVAQLFGRRLLGRGQNQQSVHQVSAALHGNDWLGCHWKPFFFLIGNQCLAFVCNQWRQKVKSNMCAPVSSAGCERVVGCQSRIKIDWRSSLKGEAMQQLMLVSLEGPTSQDISAEGPTERTNKQATSDLLDS